MLYMYKDWAANNKCVVMIFIIELNLPAVHLSKRDIVLLLWCCHSLMVTSYWRGIHPKVHKMLLLFRNVIPPVGPRILDTQTNKWSTPLSLCYSPTPPPFGWVFLLLFCVKGTVVIKGPISGWQYFRPHCLSYILHIPGSKHHRRWRANYPRLLSKQATLSISRYFQTF